MDKSVLANPRSDADWEALWASYDEATYQTILEAILQEDVILEIGAGDLRLARRMARIARRVYALEIRADLLRRGSADGLPENLVLLCGDARRMKFPQGITAGVLLMRHCLHFRRYAEKLRRAGGWARKWASSVPV